MIRKTIFAAAALLASTALPAGTASAQATLTAASCFPQGSFFSKKFESLIEQINEKGKGVVSVNYVGGAPAIGSQLTVVQKVAQGVYDLNSCTGSYYQNVVPEADAWKLLEKTPAQIRENGGMAYMNKIHNEKNLEVLARHHYGTRFHLFLGAKHKIDKPDLSGLHLRVAPIYTNFFKALGATTQDSNIAQIFTLMESGTVGGYGWPVLGHRPGWETVTKYRVDPGFYDVDLHFLANKKTWDALPKEARDLISGIALKIETDATTADPALAEKVAAKQVSGGFEVIEFTGDDRTKWLNAARKAGWDGVNAQSPEHGPKLRKFFANE